MQKAVSTDKCSSAQVSVVICKAGHFLKSGLAHSQMEEINDLQSLTSLLSMERLPLPHILGWASPPPSFWALL